MQKSSFIQGLRTFAAVVFPGLTGSDPVRKRFLEHWYADGLAQTSFAISLMGIGAVLMWLIYGLTGFEGTGWFEANQLQRFFRIVAIGLFLGVLLVFWRFWEAHWMYLAFVFIVATYAIGILLLKAKMEKTGLPMTSVGGWRSVVTQLMIIFCTFPFIRMPLWILVAVASASSATLVYVAFYDKTQAMFAAVGLFIALVAGIAIWFNNYRRERNLFSIQERLRVALEESQVLHERQSQMARAITHDIRQPMAALGIHLGQVRQRQEQGVNVNRDDLDPLSSALDALRDQVDAIAEPIFRDASVPMTLVPVRASRLVNPTAELFKPIAQEQGIELSVWIGKQAADCVVYTDETKVTTILQSLLSNAIKFAKPGRTSSQILIGLSRSGGSVSIRVFDNGLGIDQQSLPHIFERDFSDAKDSNSYGLGLYNVRRLVDALPNHTIDVASQRGKYTCLKLVLPLSDVEEVVVDSAVAAPPMDQSVTLENARVLIVEDEAIVAEALVFLFMSRGAQPVVAVTFEQAMQAVREADKPFDFLVCDYNLGAGGNGLAVIRETRALYGYQVPAVLISGEIEAIPATSDVQVMGKPFDVNELVAIAAVSLMRDSQA